MARTIQGRSRVVAVGDSSVGKTSILTTLMGDTFNPYEPNTVKANWHLHTEEVHGERIEMQIWDTAGQERYRSLGPLYYRNAVAAVVVYDITSRESFEGVAVWVDAFKAVAGADGAVFLVGNKTDLEDKRAISFEEGAELAKERQYEFYETSAKTADGVADLFRAVGARAASLRKRVAVTEEPRPAQNKDCC
jgi:small GTP-binding protein